MCLLLAKLQRSYTQITFYRFFATPTKHIFLNVLFDDFARQQEGLAFRLLSLRVLEPMLGLPVFGQVFHRFCHVFLIFCSIFARDSWMDCFEAHHGLKRAKISQKSFPDPPKSSPGASKIEF